MDTAAWVIALSTCSALCALATLWAAGDELRTARERGNRARTPPPELGQVFENVHTEQYTGFNSAEAARVISELKDQWTPRRSSIVMAWVVAPAGVLFGLAAAIVATA